MLTMQGGDSLVGGLPIIHITYQQYIANPSAYNDPDVIVHISGFPTAGNMPADYVGYDSNLNMEDIGNIATKAIAKVEPSDTALYLHEVGDGFINKGGNYCITDVQISVGGTITLGTNCHVVDGGISSNLSQTKDKLSYITPDIEYNPTNSITFSQALNNLFALIDTTKITPHSMIVTNNNAFYRVTANYTTQIMCFSPTATASGYEIYSLIIGSTGSLFLNMGLSNSINFINNSNVACGWTNLKVFY